MPQQALDRNHVILQVVFYIFSTISGAARPFEKRRRIKSRIVAVIFYRPERLSTLFETKKG